MSLTVEEIVAKVALRKQQKERQVYLRQLKQSMNEAMTKRAQNLMIDNIKKSSKAKNVTVRKDQPSKPTNNKAPIHSQTQSLIQPNNKTPNQIPQLQLKYQRLRKQYTNLTKKVTHELKLQQNYSQIQKKLQQVIRQNARLQKELDVIRMKRSKWEESVGCIEGDGMGRQTQRGMIKGKGSRVRDNGGRMKSDRVVYREDSCLKECGGKNQRKVVQMEGCQKGKVQDSCDNHDQASFNIDSKQEQAEEQVQMQIHHYTNAIQQKQHSIAKLNDIISKQQRLLQYYSNLQQVATNNSSQLYVKHARNQQKITQNQQKTAKHHQQPSQKGVSGTIVKIKRKQISNRNTFNDDNLNFYPEQKPSYLHQRQTRKKNDYVYPEKQIQQSTYTYRSPSRSVNQTSQFICD